MGGRHNHTSEILEESIEMIDIRPVHISVVCFLPEPSKAVPRMSGKYSDFCENRD